MEETILTVEQVAQILQVHPFTVLKFIKKGKLKAAKLGRVYRVRRSDVDKFLDDLTSGGGSEGAEDKPPRKTRKKNSPDKEVSPDSTLTLESEEEALKEETPIVENQTTESERNNNDHYEINFTI